MNKPLCIVQFASSSSWNGEAAHVASLCRSLAREGHHVILAYRTIRKNQPVTLWEERIDTMQVAESIPLALDSGFYPRLLLSDRAKLRERLAREPRVDVLHTHRSQDHWLAATLWFGASAVPPLVRTRHTTHGWRPHLLDRWLYSRTERVFSTCKRIDDVVGGSGLVPESRRAILHGGVDTSQFQTDVSGSRVRKELGIESSDRVVTAVGHLDPVKGYDVLIDALPDVCARIPNVRLLIVGQEGKTSFAELKAHAAERGVAEKLVLTGRREDVPEIMAATDVGVACSLGSEGNSRVTLEYMAMRVPLVATDVGALPDLVTDNETGLLVPHGNAPVLAERIVALLEDTDRAERFAANAFSQLQERYTEPAVVEELVRHYQSIVG